MLGTKTCASIRTIRHAPQAFRIESTSPAVRTRRATGWRARGPTRDHPGVQNGEVSRGRNRRALEACARRLVDRAHRQSTGRPLDDAPARFASLRLVHLQRVTGAAVLSVMYGRSDAVSWRKFGFRDVLTTDRQRCCQSPLKGSARMRRGITRTVSADRQDRHRRASA